MRVVTVTADDPRVGEYRGLTDMQWRILREPQEGFFLAEGEKVILRALSNGYRPRGALTTEKWLPGLTAAFADYDVDVLLADEATLRSIVGFRLHRGALAAFARASHDDVDAVLADARTVVALEGLVDHTNVGLVFRTAAALGIDAVLVSPTCADPYYRRSVKTSMGAVLSMPWATTGAWPEALHGLKQRGFLMAALTPDPDAADISSWLRPDQPVALLLGTEGDGLTPGALAAVDTALRIPVTDRVDSLNVAAAAAIACYAIGLDPGRPRPGHTHR